MTLLPKPMVQLASRRGLLELDLVFDHYLQHHYDDAPLEEKLLFQELLTYQDVIIFDWIFLKTPYPAQWESLLNILRTKNRAS